MRAPQNNLSTSKKFVLILLIVLFLVLISFFLFLILSDKRDAREETMVKTPIRVKVLNGCGKQGVAKKVSIELIEKNIDVISYENARKFIYDKTIIVIKRKNEPALAQLMRLTGIKKYTYALNETEYADFYIILGKDYKKLIK